MRTYDLYITHCPNAMDAILKNMSIRNQRPSKTILLITENKYSSRYAYVMEYTV